MTPSERFWAKVEKTEACWNWTGVKVKGGYGLFRDGPGAKKLAHRWVWENTAGPIPEGRGCFRAFGLGDLRPDG